MSIQFKILPKSKNKPEFEKFKLLFVDGAKLWSQPLAEKLIPKIRKNETGINNQLTVLES